MLSTTSHLTSLYSRCLPLLSTELIFHLVHANIPEAYEAFRIEPKCGILKTQLNSKEKSVQQVVSIYFTARHNHTYECQLLIEGLLGEPAISVFLTGEGSYDGKYEAILDI